MKILIGEPPSRVEKTIFSDKTPPIAKMCLVDGQVTRPV